METGESPTWAKTDPTPLPPAHTRRTQASLLEMADTLEANPGRWAVYSVHRTRGAARQRVYVLRHSKTFAGKPLEWRTAKVKPGNPESPVQILVRWNEDLES